MDTNQKPKPEMKPGTEISEKILAIVDKRQTYWGVLYDELIPEHNVEEVRLTLNNLVVNGTLRQKEDTQEHDWEYVRQNVSAHPDLRAARDVPEITNPPGSPEGQGAAPCSSFDRITNQY